MAALLHGKLDYEYDMMGSPNSTGGEGGGGGGGIVGNSAIRAAAFLPEDQYYNRSSSAPPTQVLAQRASNNNISNSSTSIESGFANPADPRHDPEYLKYYHEHSRLDPRLPPPNYEPGQSWQFLKNTGKFFFLLFCSSGTCVCTYNHKSIHSFHFIIYL